MISSDIINCRKTFILCTKESAAIILLPILMSCLVDGKSLSLTVETVKMIYASWNLVYHYGSSVSKHSFKLRIDQCIVSLFITCEVYYFWSCFRLHVNTVVGQKKGDWYWSEVGLWPKEREQTKAIGIRKTSSLLILSLKHWLTKTESKLIVYAVSDWVADQFPAFDGHFQ